MGFTPHDIPTLVRAGLLKPLGRPTPNAVKYFAALFKICASDFARQLSRKVFSHRHFVHVKGLLPVYR
jgi:hypothetical protein